MLVKIEPGERGGKPTIRGLRITVQDVLEYVAEVNPILAIARASGLAIVVGGAVIRDATRRMLSRLTKFFAGVFAGGLGAGYVH